MDESEAEMLLGLKPKPGTLVPVKSGKVCRQCRHYVAGSLRPAAATLRLS